MGTNCKQTDPRIGPATCAFSSPEVCMEYRRVNQYWRYRYLHIIVCRTCSSYNGYNAFPKIPSDVKHARSGCCTFRLLRESENCHAPCRETVLRRMASIAFVPFCLQAERSPESVKLRTKIALEHLVVP